MSTAVAERTSGTANSAEVVKAEVAVPISKSFENKVRRQFESEMGGGLQWTPLHGTLVQHLYVKLDRQFNDLEVKRAATSFKKNDPAITWANVNQAKLALDVVIRVAMELDAALPNHIHPIPYLNKRTGKYDVDLRIGYEGNNVIHRKFGLGNIVDITYQLVHEGDEFDIVRENGIQRPLFKRANYFKPGEVVGGFGYVEYANPRMNHVVVVEYREFEKAEKASKGVEFWGGEQTEWQDGKKVNAGHDDKFRKEMQYKTVVHRVCKTIPLDTSKIHSFLLDAVEASEREYIEAEVAEDADRYANKETLSLPSSETTKQEVVNVETGEVGGLSDEDIHLIEEQEAREAAGQPNF